MQESDIKAILHSSLRRRDSAIPRPTESEWKKLADALSLRLPPDFLLFHELVVQYRFEGGLLKIAHEGNVRGNDTILTAYEVEGGVGGWPSDMLPFYDVGNGDYYCLSIKDGSDSGVYFVYHEDRRVEKLHSSFGNWIKDPETYT